MPFGHAPSLTGFVDFAVAATVLAIGETTAARRASLGAPVVVVVD
jgi:hypothetical protein